MEYTAGGSGGATVKNASVIGKRVDIGLREQQMRGRLSALVAAEKALVDLAEILHLRAGGVID